MVMISSSHKVIRLLNATDTKILGRICTRIYVRNSWGQSMYRSTEHQIYYDSFLYVQSESFLQQRVSNFSACSLVTVLVRSISVLFSVVFDLINITDWEMSRDNPFSKTIRCWMTIVHLKAWWLGIWTTSHPYLYKFCQKLSTS